MSKAQAAPGVRCGPRGAGWASPGGQGVLGGGLGGDECLSAVAKNKYYDNIYFYNVYAKYTSL